MEYEYTGSYEDYDDDLLLEYCGKDLQAIKDACEQYDDDCYFDDDDGEPIDEVHTDGKAHENESVSCLSDEADVGQDENKYDDDALLLSIQKRFGCIQTTPAEPEDCNDTCVEEDDAAIFEAVRHRFASDITDQVVSNVPSGGNSDNLSQVEQNSHNKRYTIDVLKKNRFLQKVLAKKLALIQSKLRENADLKKRVIALINFEKCSKRKRTMESIPGVSVNLDDYSALKTKKQQQHSISSSAGSRNRPPDNPDVATFRLIQKKHYSICEPKPWSRYEKKALMKGVIQQIQEAHMRATMQTLNNEGNYDESYFDDQVKSMFSEGSVLSPQDIRASLHLVNWNEVSRIYVSCHGPIECWIQWSNHEDPLISHKNWTKQEDKRLWSIVKGYRLCNWKSIADALGTHRSPAQCLIRYQRSLNAGIMRSTWTAEEDDQLRAAVEMYGNQDWPTVAGTLEGRTGPQCWNRWTKTLNPSRTKTGRWDKLEDKRLKVAVSVYGPRMWKIIAEHVPGRTEVQCRERWCNVLDPSINSSNWTQEEDKKLEEAVSKHGQHKWSLVANKLKPRTDNQCWRRWKQLHPEQLSTFKKNNKIQKAAMINNFVGRKRERPNIGPYDFIIPEGVFSDNEDPIHQKPKRHKRPNYDDIQDNVIKPEICKLRRAERMKKLREARANGKLSIWRRT